MIDADYLFSTASIANELLNQTPSIQAQLYFKTDCNLGEGPIWHSSRQSYFWVDIENCRLHELTPQTNQHSQQQFDKRVSLSVIDQAGNLVLGIQGGIYQFDLATKNLDLIVEVEPKQKANRCNDGKADPEGRLWFGTMGINGEEGQGAFYCLDKDLQLKLIKDKMTIPNGLAWVPEKKLFYHIDTPTQKVECYRYDDDGNLEHLKTAIEIPSELGSPDGMTIDSNGHLWIAHWGGHGVYEWNPENGELISKIEVPAPNVTCCIFGGEDLKDLFITTARNGMTEDDLKKYPDSGSIFMARPGVKGTAAYKFFK